MSGIIRSRGRRTFTVLALGALGLAGALTVAAFASPDRAARSAATYTPASGDHVVARVPVREPAELAARRRLAASPERVELAVELARVDLGRYRRLSDPRYLGRAQATLARWWAETAPPAEVLLLRATIKQSVHDFAAARADLDRLLAIEPEHVQAHLTRAVVSTVTADYTTARESCTAIAKLVPALIVAACVAPLDGLTGDPNEAYDRLRSVLPRARRAAPQVRGWALTVLAELAIQRGDPGAAAAHLKDALAIDAGDVYARNLLADVLLATHHAAEASQLLAGRDAIDSHLVRRAIAEHQLDGPHATELVAAMRERIAAAAVRGDRTHLREEARFVLAVEGDPARALELARANWTVQKELADARLLAETAVAARDEAAAAPVVAWARTTGVRDAWLEAWLDRLERGAP